MSISTRPGLRIAPFRQIVADAPVSYSVYSAFSFYGSRRGGELPGTWLVSALGTLGHEVAAVRQTLYRMEGSQELVSRTAGRTKHYRLSPAARAEAEAGLARIMEEVGDDWDGLWTFVQFRAGSEDRVERERLRELLRAEGFAAAGSGLFVHPRDRSARLLSAAEAHGVADMIEVFRGRRLSAGSDREFVARYWRLEALAVRYRRFVARFGGLLARRSRMTRGDAFVLRFAVVFDYLETAWEDPDLPPSLLPPRWPGLRARQTARDLYQQLLPDALAFGDEVLLAVR